VSWGSEESTPLTRCSCDAEHIGQPKDLPGAGVALRDGFPKFRVVTPQAVREPRGIGAGQKLQLLLAYQQRAEADTPRVVALMLQGRCASHAST
jgi:hypothetical protein